MNVRNRKSARKTVLILVENLPVPFDRRVWQEALALTSAGYEVHIACPRTKNYSLRREVLKDIHIYRYPAGPEASRIASYLIEYPIAVLFQLFIALRIRTRRRIDIVHVCNPPDLLFLVALPLIIAGARLIYDHHDACPEVLVAKGMREDGAIVRIARILERLTYRMCRVSIETNTSFHSIALGRGRMSRDDVFIVRSAPDVGRFAGARPSDLWLRGRKHLVAYVGIMGRQDGLDYLIDAARIIIQDWRRDDILFILIGDGTEHPRLRRRVESLRISSQVEFTGLITSDEQLGSIISTADVCVSPDEANRMNDISTMNKTMEYMTLGKPVVQFDLKEGRFSADEAAIYARPNDAYSLAEGILKLVDDVELRHRMGKFGKDRVMTMLSWERQVPELLAAYERALGKTGSRNNIDKSKVSPH